MDGTNYIRLMASYNKWMNVKLYDAAAKLSADQLAADKGAFFGSVLRDDFRPDSDVDVLVTFAPGVEWSLFDHIAMEEELSALLGRKVDLISRRAIERSSNWIRRKAILETAEPFYAAR